MSTGWPRFWLLSIAPGAEPILSPVASAAAGAAAMATPRRAATALRSTVGANTRAARVTGPLPAVDDRELSAARRESNRALSNQSAVTRASDPHTAARASSTLAGPGWR